MVLADPCRGCCLEMLSISVSYRECVTNRACQEGRNQDSPYLVSGNSAPFNTICPCVCACGVYQVQDPGPGMTCFPVGLPSGAGGQVYLSWLYPPYVHVCYDRLRFDPLDR